jgi:hypothetical protein
MMLGGFVAATDRRFRTLPEPKTQPAPSNAGDVAGVARANA